MSVDRGGRVAFDGLRLKHRGSSGASRASSPVYRLVFAAGTCSVMLATLLLGAPGRPQRQRVPDHFPPKRSSQIHDGFGVNTPMPREPYLLWGRRWWTRIFDAGIKFGRIGQYENSSDYTSWDWVEQKRGVYAIPQEVDDYISSLADNGVAIELQLLYGNGMYTSPAGRLPDSILPALGSFHPPDRGLYSVFWAPTTPEQIRAFTNYVRWTVNHFRRRVRYYEMERAQRVFLESPALSRGLRCPGPGGHRHSSPDRSHSQSGFRRLRADGA